MNEEILKYQISLSLIEGIGDVLAKNLVSYCGSAEAVFREKKQRLMKIPGIGSSIAGNIVNYKVFDKAEEEISFIRKHKVTPLFYTDRDYPYRLKNVSDSPLMLYYLGNSNLNNEKVIGIVGTRNATNYGKAFCEELVGDLSKFNCLIVSGLAYGVDICSHKAALNYGLDTIGVLAHGLDRLYPPAHKNIAKQMVSQGGLLSENLTRTNPDRENFPKRNRIVAGMCDALVVVETAEKGGAMITAELANSYNRDVMALPGRRNDEFSRGCNMLIRQNKASLIESADDLIYCLGWDVKLSGKQVQKDLFSELTPTEQELVSIIRENDIINHDELYLKSGINNSKLALILLDLEFRGLIRSLPGKTYQIS